MKLDAMDTRANKALLLVVATMSLVSSVVGCARQPQTIRSVRNVVLVTIDTLRADHVGAYGYPRAHTPTIDAIANGGVLFEHAYSAAPITLTSHATMMTGRYPPGHGARDNGVRVSDTVPTLASTLKASGFATAAFVAAFPLDHQFGLNRGFDLYSDRMPRGPDGKLLNERPASQVVDEALRYLESRTPNPESRRFVWIHLFEPHAPYGDPSSGGSAIDRYDAEIATADRELGRLLPSINRTDTAIVVAADHGEAFGEHGEYAHSIFVYDTTLRVPLVINAPGLSARHVMNRVTLADLAPTIARLAGATMTDVDGIDLGPALTGGSLPARELYAESFAPLLEFGWAPLRSIRSGNWKFIAAPTPELFDIDRDAGEDRNVASQETQVAQQLGQRVGRYASASLTANGAAPDAADRLRALGYSSRSQQPAASNRPDPKDRREIAARIAQVTAGELTGDALMSALKTILSADQTNSQAHLRLGYGYVAKNDCAHAIPEFAAAANAGLPSADAHLGLATCYGRQGDLAAADRALKEAQRREPDNPVISANIGILQASRGEFADAIRSLTAALAKDPDLHEARFNLAIVYAKAGRRADAAAAARELLARLPSNAPQRPEVERLLQSVQ